MGWWMWTISQYHDQQSSAEDKIHPNIKDQIPLLLILGASVLFASMLLGEVVEDLTGVSLEAVVEIGKDKQPDLTVLMPLMKATVLHTILSIPITMATYFAPPLIALQGRLSS